MSAIATLVPRGTIPNTSAEILQEAIACGFQSVIVFGFDGSTVSIRASCSKSNLELIGALEAAKQQLWSNA